METPFHFVPFSHLEIQLFQLPNRMKGSWRSGRLSCRVGKPTSFQEISPARSKNHSYQCISKADPERESSSFSRMGITAALTFLVDYSKDNELWVFVCGLDRFKDKKLPDPK